MLERKINKFQIRLKEWRKHKGWTQKHLSALTGIDHGYIPKLESATKQNPSLKTLLRLCKSFKCTLFELTGE